MNMEITEHKPSKLQKLSKKIRPLEDKDLDKSLGKIDEASSPFEKSNEISFIGSQKTERDLAPQNCSRNYPLVAFILVDKSILTVYGRGTRQLLRELSP